MNEEEKKALRVINARTRRLLDELEKSLYKKLSEVLKNKYKMYWIWKRKRKTYEDTKNDN